MQIQHNKDLHQFSVEINGYKALVNYLIQDGALDIDETFVPKEIGGRGIASALVKAAYDYALSQGLKCKGTCSYAAVWLERHSEYNSDKTQNILNKLVH